MKVRFISKSRRHALTPGNTYRVIGIEADDYRVMNDHGQPCLYPPRLFQVVDPEEPSDWRTTYGSEGERYAYPPELSAPGFFEDYFDRKLKAMSVLQYYLVKQAEPRSRARKSRRAG